jgi:hypothetical protein
LIALLRIPVEPSSTALTDTIKADANVSAPINTMELLIPYASAIIPLISAPIA